MPPKTSSRVGDHNSQAHIRPVSPLQNPNAVVGVFVQIARKYFFVDTKKVAIFYFFAIAALAVIPEWVTMDSSAYIVQKHSVFNQYGVKLGWFWTCLVLGPFIWLTSKAQYRRDKDKWIIDLMRLGVATGLWYICTTGFHRLLSATSSCDKGKGIMSNRECALADGVWRHGFDISGHCFLMLYSLLIMSEEAKSFRNWKDLSSPDQTDSERQELAKTTRYVEYHFLAMLVLTIIWWKQLVISTLYYHLFIDKVVGAMVAVACWFVTYRMLYPIGILQTPVNRVKKATRRH